MAGSSKRRRVAKRSTKRTVAKRGSQAAAAVFALGMSVAGPQALGTAFAAPSEDQATSGEGAASETSRTSGASTSPPRRPGSKAASDSPGQSGSAAVSPKAGPADTGTAVERASIALPSSTPASAPASAPVSAAKSFWTPKSVTPAVPAPVAGNLSAGVAPKVSPAPAPAVNPLGGLFAALQSLFAGAAAGQSSAPRSLFGGPSVTYDPSQNVQVGKVITGVLDVDAVGGFSLSNSKPKWTPVSSNARRANSGVTTSQRGAQAPVQPANGTVTLNPDGTFSYVPNEEFGRQGGIDTFTVTVTDSRGRTTVVPVTVVVNGNDAPTGATITVAEPDPSGLVLGSVVGNDPDDDPLIYTRISGPSKGTVTVDPDTGEFAYTPDPVARHAAAADAATEDDLTDTFVVTVDDGRGGTVDVPIKVKVLPFNRVPEATIRSEDPVAETGIVSGAVVATDPDGDPLTFGAGTITTPKGTVIVNPDGTYSYTPDAAARKRALVTGAAEDAVDSFTVTIDDGYGGRKSVVVEVAVLPGNIAPVLDPTLGTPAAEDGVVTGFAGGTDADDAVLTYSGSATSSKGTLVVDPSTGALTYTPNPDVRHAAAREGAGPEDTTDTFTITVDDGYGGTATKVITVPIGPANVAPDPVTLVSKPDPRTGGTIITLSARDADGDALTFLSPVASVGGGIVEAGATSVDNPEDTGVAADDVYSGVFTYTPTPEARFRALDPAFRVDSFTVQARDGYGGVVTFTIEVPIDPPVLGLTETRIDVSTGAALADALEKSNPADPAGGRSRLVRGAAGSSLLTNGNFESPGVPDGTVGSSVTPTGWTFTGSGGDANVVDPNTGALGYATSNDVVYFYQPTGARTLYQDTVATVAAGDVVTLSVDVGNRGGSRANDPLADSTFIAIATTGGTILAQRDITQADLGPDGTFRTFTITYATQAADVGNPLRVILGTGPDATAAAYADFDNAVLTTRTSTAANTDEVFLGGNYLELGISDVGSFGTRSSKPTGFYGTSRSTKVGLSNDIDGFYNTDPAVDTNSTDDGEDARIDFFLPGSPEERWSIGYNNTQYGGFSALTRVSGTATTLTDTVVNDTSDLATGTMSGTFSTTVQGALKVHQVHSFKVNDNYFTTTVTLTNVSGAALENVQFMRSFDPDNTVFQSGSYQTINRITAQYATSGYSMVTGTSQAGDAYQTKTGEQASIFYFTSDPDALVYTGGFANSNPYEFSKTLQGVGTEFVADQAIGVIFQAGDLADGDSKTFTYVTALTTGDDAARFAANLADAEVAESTPGAVVGKAFVLPGLDGLVYTVTGGGDNFEIAGDVLKLKDGVSLSRGDSPQSITVTATKDGISISKDFKIAVV